MAGTMEGLGIPIFGGYTAYQSDGTTPYLTVNSDGTHDYTFTGEGAENFIQVTVVDTETRSSGYLQAFYVNLRTSGVLSGSAQVNTFAVDLTLSGTPGVEVAGMYMYICETGTTVMDNCNLNGIVIYFEEMGDVMAYRAGVKVYSDDDSIASSLDAAFTTVSANAGLFGAMLGHKGATMPYWFLHIQNLALNQDMMYPASDESSIVGGLKVRIADSHYFIPLYNTSCSD